MNYLNDINDMLTDKRSNQISMMTMNKYIGKEQIDK